MSADLVIVGGGPVGLATGILARKAGLSATVLDKRSEPMDKACGEGLMPPGVRELEAMGVEVPEWGCMPFEGIRYLDGATLAEGRFLSGSGLGVRRTALMEGMLKRARSLGVDLRLETKVTDWSHDDNVKVATTAGTITGRWLVAADGLHSAVRKRAGLERDTENRGRFGVRRHFACKPWSTFVEVYWSDDVEAYVTPAGPELVGVALLWRGKNERFETLLARFPELEARLGGSENVSRLRGAGPFRQTVAHRTTGRLALVGDAAGYLDPLTGEGMSLGFRSARALVDVLSKELPLAAYERAYRDLSRNYYRMTGMLLRIGARPRLRRRVVSMLARRPDLFSTMLAVNSGDLPPTALGLGGAFGLVSGILRG